ncbi:uncharacterized protein BDV14DRAFT_154412 [Aspergillus stella-maris]|uniref:uncharacterized protein n=1 Tax=Aspergillus stella-maris TaxID=1810926 RepID=UPI003CCDDEDA
MRADFASRCDAPWALSRQESPLPVRNSLFRWLTCPCKAAEPSHTSFIPTFPLGRRFLPPTYSSRLRPRLSASLFWESLRFLLSYLVSLPGYQISSRRGKHICYTAVCNTLFMAKVSWPWRLPGSSGGTRMMLT